VNIVLLAIKQSEVTSNRKELKRAKKN